MVTVPLELNTEPIRGEKRVVFYHLSWLSYQQILQALGENNRAHLFYDRGTLEITMPLEEQEFYRELIGRFIYFLVSELGLKIKSLGSTTLAREDLERGAEPDNASYIQNQAKVLGKRINLTEYPPPDLVVEVDITHTDINKLALYARLGVPELWRFNGQIWRIYRLEKGVYQEEEFSPTFPLVLKTKLYEFLATAKEDEVRAEKNLRGWCQQTFKN